jgi:hypothetical protein
VRGHRARDRGPGVRPSRSTVPRCETPSGSRLWTNCGTLYSSLKTTPASGCCADRRRRQGVLQRRGRPDGVRAEQAPGPAAGSEVHGAAARGGYALGGGFELALSCDLIVASNTPTFGPQEFSVGVAPAFAPIPLAEVAGRAWTKSQAWSARRATVAEAYQRGVLDRIVADAELDAESLRVAQGLTKLPRVAAEVVKASANRDIADRVLYHGATTAAAMCGTAGIAEGRAAGPERRTPVFPDEFE